ncbi:hypothetical protein [Melghirimyces algeriensis]|uniref:Uncharacterized protein n=1 Tax=Melghirimyces algeriensis TaxID=910412 RepID=A0A521F7Q9_9BACL|nr:hypothetical protein [Melghirimyces algeriensis]SMO91570.1 hypothetical protein SAMN06264849_11333 [Melghirimyces algeriensis]
MVINKTVKCTIIYMLTLAIFISFGFPKQAFASNSKITNEQKIQVLADQIEFLVEEALVVKNGERTYDFDKIENRFGTKFANELKSLTVDKSLTVNSMKTKPQFIKIPGRPADNVWAKCVIEALADNFGVGIITAAIEGGFYAYLKKKAYHEAAKLLARFIVGSNAAGLAATLIYYGSKCSLK